MIKWDLTMKQEDVTIKNVVCHCKAGTYVTVKQDVTIKRDLMMKRDEVTVKHDVMIKNNNNNLQTLCTARFVRSQKI